MPVRTPILITGASGFVGSNLLRKLASQVVPKNIHVVLRKRSNTRRIDDLLKKVSVHVVDLRSLSETDRFVRRVKPKTVFHLATHGAYPYQQYDEREIIDTNIICTFNLLQSCLKLGFEAFINTGSSSEYGINQKPMKEDDALRPITAYGASKAWATLYCEYLAKAQKAPIITLRPFAVYGPYEPKGRLIPNIILSLMKMRRPHLASPEIVRDFVFVNDVVLAYLSAASQPISGKVFNIASGKETTLKEVFSILKSIMKVNMGPIWDKSESRSFDTKHWVADIGLINKFLDWSPRTNLKDGLRLTAYWFKKNIRFYES